jgi:hypothetical protein
VCQLAALQLNCILSQHSKLSVSRVSGVIAFILKKGGGERKKEKNTEFILASDI